MGQGLSVGLRRVACLTIEVLKNLVFRVRFQTKFMATELFDGISLSFVFVIVVANDIVFVLKIVLYDLHFLHA